MKAKTVSLKQKISMTGYRLLYILQLLSKAPRRKEELVELINNHYDMPGICSDTLRLDLNTLISVGFDIKSKYFNPEYKYVLIHSPINISFNQNEASALNGLKRALMEVCDWHYVLSLYELFEKISTNMADRNSANDLMDFGYFLSVDVDILKALNSHCEQKDEIEILYKSPNGGEKTMRLRCLRIEYNRETKKMYLWCKLKDREEFSYLRVEKVLEIIFVSDEKTIEIPEVRKCRYRVHQGDDFHPCEDERVVRIENDFIEIESNVLCDFHFVQKILSMGDSCFWVENIHLRKKILDTLKGMRIIYGDACETTKKTRYQL